MKTIKLLCFLLFAATMSAGAADLTTVQQNAQRAVYAYLQKEKYDPTVDTSDNSVCFRKGGVLYWITFEENSPILYTLHRKAFKVGTDDKSYKREPSIVAANAVNLKRKVVKLTVEEKKVDIAIHVYATTTKAFLDVFDKCFELIANVDVDFREAYAKAMKAQEEEHERLLSEIRKDFPPSELRGLVQTMSFRLVDGDGYEKSAYDQPLRSFNARYLQCRVEFEPWKQEARAFTLQVKITKPDGKVITLPNGRRISTEMSMTLEKSKKTQLGEFAPVGSDKEGFWKAGEYKVELMEQGDVIYTTSFNIL